MTRSLRMLAAAGAIALSTASLSPSLFAQTPPNAPADTPPMMDHAMPGHTMPGSGQGMPDHGAMQGMSPDQMRAMMQHHEQMTGMHGHHGAQMGAAGPTLPGQDAFGAIQEVVRMLEADPKTDWSKVNLEALRQHLIDMNDVTLKADVVAKPVDGGVEIAVTGEGRTVAAIQRMVPAHAGEVERTHLNGWSAKTEPLPQGVRLTVTATDAKEVAHVRALGFIGILASGAHHQLHHLAMAKGEFAHVH